MLKPDDELYTILGVARGSSAGEIKLAYRRLCKKHHPDANGGEESPGFSRISHAYAILRDAKAKADYDESGTFRTTAGSESDDTDRALINLFCQLVRGHPNIYTINVVTEVRRHLQTNIDQGNTKISEHLELIKKAITVASRIKSTREDDLVLIGIRGMEADARRAIEGTRAQLEKLDRMVGRLDELEFDSGALSNLSQQAYVTWGSGTNSTGW